MTSALRADMLLADGFSMPPQTHKRDGSQRRVGFEIEFSGLDIDTASSAVAAATSGTLEQSTSSEHTVHSDLGEFAIEVDWQFLKKQAREAASRDDNSDWTVALRELAKTFVPVEVVCPPIPLESLGELDSVTESLREQGAQGTEASLVSAYGVHINAEAPDLNAETLHRYLRAFSLLQWWLVREHDVDIARRASSYVRNYPEAYLHSVHELRDPTQADVMEHYLDHNATRNRALDMLPLFAEIDEDMVRSATGDDRIGSRPTFHYRLPDSRVDAEGWDLSIPWNKWCVVEALAADPESIEALSAEFRTSSRGPLGVSKEQWIARIDQWLSDRASA